MSQFHGRKVRRCYYYQPNGTPWVFNGRVGCPNYPYCGFAHPDDPEWEAASIGVLPPHFIPDRLPQPPARPPSPYGPPPPPPPPYYGMPPGAPRDRKPSTSSTHADRDRDVDMLASRSSFGRGHSPAQSIASSSARRQPYIASGARERDAERDRERDDERGRYRDDEERSRDRDKRRDDERHRDDDHRRDSTRRRGDKSGERRSRSSSRAHRHSSSSRRRRSSSREHKHRKSEPPPKELTPEEQRKLWLRRVELLQQVIQTRTEHVRLHDELKKLDRLAKSVSYESLPEEDKTALQSLIAATTTRFRTKEHELNDLAGKLIPDDFWPFAQRAQQISDPGYQRMTEVLASLKDDVDGLHNAIGTMQQTSQPSAAAPAPAPVPAAKLEPGEVPNDVPEGASRPKKRRRLSNGTEPPMADISAAELEKMQDSLAALTLRIVELQNNMLQYDDRVADEVESQLDYKMSLLRIKNGEIDKPAAPELQQMVQKLSEGLEEAKRLADLSAQQLSEVQAEGKKLDKEYELLQRQNDVLRAQIEKLEADRLATATKEEQQRAEIAALKEAITSVVARAASPPIPPAPLTADQIVEAIRPRLVDAAREDLLPLLTDVRKHIEKELTEQSNLVSGELMTQMAPAVRSVEWIAAWIDRIRGPNGQPVMSSPAPSSTTAPSATAAAGSSTAGSASTSTNPAASASPATPRPVPTAPRAMSMDKGKGVAR
ncbi:hypothetical protein C2E23DRAFT_372619 [Lenzites betulinus]|nr:hypothetical protein C2E23DRAFT_372619 [Lenzites betulinus]